MAMQEDAVFARTVLQNKLLTPQQVQACLRVVEKAALDGNTILLADVVLRNNFLSPEKINAVSWAVQYTITRSRDKIIAEILLEKKFVGEILIAKTTEVRDSMFKTKKQTMSILDILVNAGKIKRDKATEVSREVEKREIREAGKKESAAADEEAGAVRIEKAGACKVTIKTLDLPTGRGYSLMELAGSLDADSFQALDGIMATIWEQEGDAGKYVILDLSRVDYMSSSGIGIILDANNQANNKGGALVLANVTPEVQEILELVGLDDVLGFFTMKKALKKITKA